MNAIFKDVLKQAEQLSPEDQQKLATEMEQRAYEIWLEAEIQKGVDSLDRGEEIPAEQVFAELRTRLRDEYGV